MSTHTPGPWEYEVAGYYCDEGYYCDDTIESLTVRCSTDLGIVCVVEGAYQWSDEEPKRSNSEVEANARLIAAAPTMYEALESLCAALIHDHNRDLDYWQAARTALSLARGEG